MSRRNGRKDIFAGVKGAAHKAVPNAVGGERAEKAKMDAWLAKRKAGHVPSPRSLRSGIKFWRQAR